MSCYIIIFDKTLDQIAFSGKYYILEPDPNTWELDRYTTYWIPTFTNALAEELAWSYYTGMREPCNYSEYVH